MPLQSSQLKILLIIDNLSTGGAQRQMVQLATGLKERNHQVEVFCYASGDMLAQPLYEKDIPVHWYLKPSRFSVSVIAYLYRLIEKGNYNLTLSFLTTPNLYSIISGKIIKPHGLPTLVSERFCDLPGQISLIERLSRRFYFLADQIIVNSHHQRLNFEVKYPRLKDHISTIYNGYDLNFFAPKESIPGNHLLKLLTIASVSRYKNGLCLVEALKILREQYDLTPSVTWIGQKVLTGDRLNYLNEMEQQIQTYNLGSQWQWLGQRNDIVQQMQQHSVLIHPSYGEGLPNVVCEALACGLPVIVSNTLDHPRLVQNGDNGFLFDWRNPHDLAQIIKNFSELPQEKRKEMGKKGRQFAEQNLSISRYIDEYEQMFSDVLNRL